MGIELEKVQRFILPYNSSIKVRTKKRDAFKISFQIHINKMSSESVNASWIFEIRKLFLCYQYLLFFLEPEKKWNIYLFITSMYIRYNCLFRSLQVIHTLFYVTYLIVHMQIPKYHYNLCKLHFPSSHR